MSGVELVFASCEAYIVTETERAVGIGEAPVGDVDFWVPKSQIGHFTYATGDSVDVRIGQPIEAVEMPRWLAAEHGLDVED